MKSKDSNEKTTLNVKPLKTSKTSITEPEFVAYRNEVLRSQRVILSMPVINQQLKSIHEFMVDMYNSWIITLDEIENETNNLPKKKTRTRRKKRVTKSD